MPAWLNGTAMKTATFFFFAKCEDSYLIVSYGVFLIMNLACSQYADERSIYLYVWVYVTFFNM